MCCDSMIDKRMTLYHRPAFERTDSLLVLMASVSLPPSLQGTRGSIRRVRNPPQEGMSRKREENEKKGDETRGRAALVIHGLRQEQVSTT